MMSKNLCVKVSPRKSGDEEWFEAMVFVPGLKPTKLARKSDGNTKFPTKSSVNGAAKNLAKALGFADVDFGQEATQVKKAAKKTTTATKATRAIPTPLPASTTATTLTPSV